MTHKNYKIDWKKLATNIPGRVKIAPKSYYTVYRISDFEKEIVGETDFQKQQIVIKQGLSSKLTTETYIHEVLHALSAEHGIGLTETQILQFESAFPYLIKLIKEL